MSTTKRFDLLEFVLYQEAKSGQYFYTPDNVGCIWSDNYDDIQGDCINGNAIIIDELED
jgi:hypothetical protein